MCTSSSTFPSLFPWFSTNCLLLLKLASVSRNELSFPVLPHFQLMDNWIRYHQWSRNICRSILAKDDVEAGGYIGERWCRWLYWKNEGEGVCYNLYFPLARSLPRHVTILNEHSDDDDDNEDGRDDYGIGRLLLNGIYSLHNPQFVQPSIPASSASPIWFKERSHKFQSFMLMSTTLDNVQPLLLLLLLLLKC